LAIDKNLILVVTTNVHYNRPSRASAALLIDQYGPEIDTGGFGVVLVRHPHQPEHGVERILNIGEAFDFLADGDVVRVMPDRTVSVIYRLNASINSLHASNIRGTRRGHSISNAPASSRWLERDDHSINFGVGSNSARHAMTVLIHRRA
jgi:hypothetical protein